MTHKCAVIMEMGNSPCRKRPLPVWTTCGAGVWGILALQSAPGVASERSTPPADSETEKQILTSTVNRNNNYSYICWITFSHSLTYYCNADSSTHKIIIAVWNSPHDTTPYNTLSRPVSLTTPQLSLARCVILSTSFGGKASHFRKWLVAQP
jgi:hypothetical protein